MGVKILAPTGIRSPDRPAHSESLYRLSYRGPHLNARLQKKKYLPFLFIILNSCEVTKLSPFGCITVQIVVSPFGFATARVPVHFSYQWRLHLRRLVADDSLPVSYRDTFTITRNPTKRNIMCSSRAIKQDKQLL